MAKAKTPSIETEAPAAKTRDKVLVKKTASQLHELIGDTPIGVSLKELKLIVLKAGAAKILADAGV